MKGFNLIKKIVGSVVAASIFPIGMGICAINGCLKPSIDPTFIGGAIVGLIAEAAAIGIVATIAGLIVFFVWCFSDNNWS